MGLNVSYILRCMAGYHETSSVRGSSSGGAVDCAQCSPERGAAVVMLS